MLLKAALSLSFKVCAQLAHELLVLLLRIKLMQGIHILRDLPQLGWRSLRSTAKRCLRLRSSTWGLGLRNRLRHRLRHRLRSIRRLSRLSRLRRSPHRRLSLCRQAWRLCWLRHSLPSALVLRQHELSSSELRCHTLKPRQRVHTENLPVVVPDHALRPSSEISALSTSRLKGKPAEKDLMVVRALN